MSVAAEPHSRSQDRQSRLRPFAWMRRFTRKRTAANDGQLRITNRNPFVSSPTSGVKRMKRSPKEMDTHFESHTVTSSSAAAQGRQEHRQLGSIGSDQATSDGGEQSASHRSIAPTVATNQDTVLTDGDHMSKAGTNATLGGGISTTSGGNNSIFSSSNHSAHSLTTTLTTIQSQPSAAVHSSTPTPTQQPQTSLQSQPSTYFSHQYQYPTGPVSALPAHMAPNHQAHLPTTYRSATANNLLTDDASIITLASSSHRRQRRNSDLDTDASVRAIRPWGGSQESLPLSVLSQNFDFAGSHAAQAQSRSSGVGAPLLSSERNSIYAGRSVTGANDGTNATDGSVRSGFTGHMRTDSTAGSIGGYSNAFARENVVQDVRDED